MSNLKHVKLMLTSSVDFLDLAMMEVSILPSSPLHAVDTKKGKNLCVHASTSVLPPSSVELPSVAKATWLCLAGYKLSQTGWPRLLQTGARAIPDFPHHGQGNQLCCAWYKFHAEAPLPPSSFDPIAPHPKSKQTFPSTSLYADCVQLQ